MALKELVSTLWVCGGLEKLILTVSNLGGCGGPERTDFNSFYFGWNVVILKEQISNSFYY